MLPAWYQDETLTDYEGPMSRHFEIECAMTQAELEAQGTTYRLRHWSGCNVKPRREKPGQRQRKRATSGNEDHRPGRIELAR